MWVSPPMVIGLQKVKLGSVLQALNKEKRESSRESLTYDDRRRGALS